MLPFRLPNRFRFDCFVTALALAASLMLVGCDRTPTIITEAAGHTVTAQIEGSPTVNTQPTSAMIGGPHGTVTIEAERLRLDDLAWTKIPAGVAVTVTIKRHQARITAGPVTIKRTIND